MYNFCFSGHPLKKSFNLKDVFLGFKSIPNKTNYFLFKVSFLRQTHLVTDKRKKEADVKKMMTLFYLSGF